jgi:hypothetical protein
MGTTATHSLAVGEGITKFVESSSAANSDTVISAPAKKHQIRLQPESSLHILANVSALQFTFADAGVAALIVIVVTSAIIAAVVIAITKSLVFASRNVL